MFSLIDITIGFVLGYIVAKGDMQKLKGWIAKLWALLPFVTTAASATTPTPEEKKDDTPTPPQA